MACNNVAGQWPPKQLTAGTDQLHVEEAQGRGPSSIILSYQNKKLKKGGREAGTHMSLLLISTSRLPSSLPSMPDSSSGRKGGILCLRLLERKILFMQKTAEAWPHLACNLPAEEEGRREGLLSLGGEVWKHHAPALPSCTLLYACYCLWTLRGDILGVMPMKKLAAHCARHGVFQVNDRGLAFFCILPCPHLVSVYMKTEWKRNGLKIKTWWNFLGQFKGCVCGGAQPSILAPIKHTPAWQHLHLFAHGKQAWCLA